MGTVTRTVEVEGGRYRNGATGEIVEATHWTKDGDHPLAQRYPIDGREYRGLLIVSEKEKHALRYGDWICEDAKGRFFIVAEEVFARDYVEAA